MKPWRCYFNPNNLAAMVEDAAEADRPARLLRVWDAIYVPVYYWTYKLRHPWAWRENRRLEAGLTEVIDRLRRIEELLKEEPRP